MLAHSALVCWAARFITSKLTRCCARLRDVPKTEDCAVFKSYLRTFVLAAAMVLVAAGIWFMWGDSLSGPKPPSDAEVLSEMAGKPVVAETAPRLRFIGVGTKQLGAIVGNRTIDGKQVNLNAADEGQRSDVTFVSVIDWAQLEQIQGAVENCGESCTPGNNVWLARRVTVNANGTYRKMVFVNFANFVSIRNGVFRFDEKANLECLLLRLADEGISLLGDALPRTCLDALPNLGNSQTILVRNN